MIRHIITLMWNQKKINVFIIIEIFFSFLVLFALSGVVYYCLKNYFKPIGFSYENVVVVRVSNFGVHTNDKVTQDAILFQLKAALLNLDETEFVSRGNGVTPYGRYTRHHRFLHNGRSINSYSVGVDQDFGETLHMPLLEGRWFDERDQNSKLTPVVINAMLKEIVFGDAEAIGHPFGKDYMVVGVIEDFRFKGEFYKPFSCYFEPYNIYDGDVGDTFIIKTRSGVGVKFKGVIRKLFSGIAKSWTIQIDTLEKRRRDYMKRYFSLIIIFGVLVGFLLMNVALGIFGVLWNTINKRRAEIGLRKAIGAFPSDISFQITGEMFALTTLGVLMGYLIIFQFPLLNVFNISSDVYALAILVSTLCIYVFVAICSFYPSRLAANIEPAVALHDE